ncbi:ATPase [Shigella dysenteriae]|uniref:ATPase n=1 Tax=Shigella dysenteriae TaxID=622 RepID=A0A2X2IF67_SHIDY|nr:ATPase [Shigella dysenteriae]
MAVTAAKSVMAFRVLTMAVDLCRLTTRTMNVNAGHERKPALYIRFKLEASPNGSLREVSS